MNKINFQLKDKEKINLSIGMGIKKIYPPIENLEITPSKEQQIFTHENSYGYDKVTVNAVSLQDKNITLNQNGVYTITADDGYNGLDEVNITLDAIEDLSTELTGYNNQLTTQETTLDDLYLALQNKGIIEKKYAPEFISFYGCPKEELDSEIKGLDTKNMTDMKRMFSSSSLTTLDLSSFNTSEVTDMSYMFYNCNYLEFLNISSFDTSKVTNMYYMFSNCSRLITLDLSDFNTSSVTTMTNMFANCGSLTSINVSNFNTQKTTAMENMFQGLAKLTDIDLSSFDTSQVTKMGNMFSGCTALTSLNLSNFNTQRVTTFEGMFQNMTNLNNIDLSSFDTSNVNYMVNMFAGCTSLTSLDLSNFTMPRLTFAYSMFAGCSNLKSINLSNLVSTNSSTLNMSNFFNGCKSLEHLDIRNLLCTRIRTYSNMFNGVPANCEIIVKDDEQRNWVLAQRSDFTNVKTVAELEAK